MSLRYQASIMATKYFPLKTPNAPTIGTASIDSDTSIAVTFTAPSIVGDSAITEYRAVALDASTGQTFVATGTTSPIKITGLNNGNFYTAKVYAVNSYGNSPFSAPSNSVGLTVKYFTTAGTYTFVVPTGVTTLSAAAVGGGGGSYGNGNSSTAGGGGGGGAFRYVNNISVTAGASITVTVGAAGTSGLSSTNGGTSSFGTYIVANGGTRSSGSSGGAGGSGGTGSGGNGGAGNSCGGNYGTGWQGGGGGGGAGGYSTNGGGGGNASLSNPPYNHDANGSWGGGWYGYLGGGGSGGFGGGNAGYVGGGVGFDIINGGKTTVWSQSNQPLSGGYAYDGEAGYYGGGGGGSAAAAGYVARPPEGGAVQVKWGGMTY